MSLESSNVEVKMVAKFCRGHGFREVKAFAGHSRTNGLKLSEYSENANNQNGDNTNRKMDLVKIKMK